MALVEDRVVYIKDDIRQTWKLNMLVNSLISSQYLYNIQQCYTNNSLSVCWNIVLQKKRMRRKADWSKAGGPIDILKACQEITAGRGGHLLFILQMCNKTIVMIEAFFCPHDLYL